MLGEKVHVEIEASRNLPPHLTLLWRLVVAILPLVLFTLQAKVDGTLVG